MKGLHLVEPEGVRGKWEGYISVGGCLMEASVTTVTKFVAFLCEMLFLLPEMNNLYNFQQLAKHLIFKAFKV